MLTSQQVSHLARVNHLSLRMQGFEELRTVFIFLFGPPPSHQMESFPCPDNQKCTTKCTKGFLVLRAKMELAVTAQVKPEDTVKVTLISPGRTGGMNEDPGERLGKPALT